MLAYDKNKFQPPAPVANVVFRNPNNGATWSDVPMLLDTGADVTLVPRVALEHLGIEPDPNRQYELLSFDGSASLAQIAQLELVFLNRRFRGSYLLIDQDHGIMGRNILNAVQLVLNGPMLTWDELKQT